MNGNRGTPNPSAKMVGVGSKFPSKFMAGRGRALQAMKAMPLEAEEFARRKKMQELFAKGKLSLPEDHIPESLLRLQTSHSIKEKAKKQQNLSSPALKIKPYLPDKNTVLFSTGLSDLKPTNRMESAETAITSVSPMTKASGLDLAEEQEATPPREQLEELSLSCNYSTGLQESNFISKDIMDFNIKKTSKPLRRPDKTKNKAVNSINKEESVSSSLKEEFKSSETCSVKSEEARHEPHKAWLDWEQNVVVEGLLPDEDVNEIAVVEDNDDIHDIIVDQYLDGLHKQHKKETSNYNKITPHKVQQLSNLKSTSNADCAKVAPGTVPNPPKGDDRWGGHELSSIAEPTGWGNIENENVNWYNDGSSYWSASASNPYGGVSWSNCS